MKKSGKRSLLWSFIAFWSFLLFFKFGGALHYSLIPVIGDKLMPLWLVGIVSSTASILQLVMDIPAGRLLDRFGYKKILIISTSVFIIGALFLYLNLTIPVFLLSIFFCYFGWLFYGPGSNAYSLSHALKSESGRFMDYRDIFGGLGVVFSSITLVFAINQGNKVFSLIIALVMFLSLLSIISSPSDKRRIVLKDNPHERTHKQRIHVFNNLFKAIRGLNPASTLLMFLNLSGAAFYGVIWFVIPLVIASGIHNSGLLGIGLSMFDLAIVVAGIVMIRFVDKYDKKVMILIGLMLFAIAGMFLGLSFGIPFLVLAFLTTSGDEIAALPLWAWLHKLDKNHNKDGLISGIINLFEDLGWAIGPLIAGILYTTVGPKLTIIIGAIPLIVLAIIYQFAVRKHSIHVSILDVPKKPRRHRHKY